MNLEKRHQLWIGTALVLLVAATHGHHFATALHLPPATWAVFFLAGLYVRSARLFALLLAEVVLIDYVAITLGGVSSFCVTPAYAMLLPAYGGLWLAGRWFAARCRFSFTALPALAASLLGSVTLAELLTSGGFYFFGGRYADPTLAEFGARLVKYFPGTLQSFAFWIGVALAVHIAFVMARGDARKHA